jgi:hypothetical protein
MDLWCDTRIECERRYQQLCEAISSRLATQYQTLSTGTHFERPWNDSDMHQALARCSKSIGNYDIGLRCNILCRGVHHRQRKTTQTRVFTRSTMQRGGTQGHLILPQGFQSRHLTVAEMPLSTIGGLKHVGMSPWQFLKNSKSKPSAFISSGFGTSTKLFLSSQTLDGLWQSARIAAAVVQPHVKVNRKGIAVRIFVHGAKT